MKRKQIKHCQESRKCQEGTENNQAMQEKLQHQNTFKKEQCNNGKL